MTNNIYKILPILLLLTCCTRQSKITIDKYSYSDSILQQSKDNVSELSLKSEVDLCLLSTTSNDKREQAVVKKINNSILEQITQEHINKTADSICKYIVKDNLDEMSELASNMYSYLLQPADTMPDDSDNLIYSFYNNFTTDCHFGLGDSIICYSYKSSSYLGGAHPGTYSFAQSYLVSDGSLVHPSMIFKGDNKVEMVNRLIDKLVIRFNVKNKEELHGLGFEISNLSDNILLNSDSLTFHFDTYTIAPWVYGEIDVSFSYEEIKDIFAWSQRD